MRWFAAYIFGSLLLCQTAAAQFELKFPASQFGKAYLLPQQSTDAANLESLLNQNAENFEFVAAFSEAHPTKRLSKSIGRVDILRRQYLYDPWVGTCTGTLIAPDLIITAAHCFFTSTGHPHRIDGARIRFKFYGDPVANGEGEDFRLTLPPVEFNIDVDYAIVKVDKSPGSKFGTIPIRTGIAATAGEELFLIHHPLAQPMRVTRKNCRAVTSTIFLDSELRHSCDTLPDSSGAPIFSDVNSVLVGIHTRGFRPNVGNNFNSGSPITAILEKSVILKNPQQAVVAVAPAPEKVSHCYETFILAFDPQVPGESPQVPQVPPVISFESAFRKHLPNAPQLRSRYTRTAENALARATFKLPGIIRGSFDTVSSTITECDGNVPLTTSIILQNVDVIGVTISHSYRASDLYGAGDSKSYNCVTMFKHGFSLGSAFAGIVEDTGLKGQVSKSGSNYKETRILTLSNSILAFTRSIVDDGYDKLRIKDIHRCTESIFHTISGRQ